MRKVAGLPAGGDVARGGASFGVASAACCRPSAHALVTHSAGAESNFYVSLRMVVFMCNEMNAFMIHH